MSSTRINISVPQELADRMRALRIPVSAVCQQALTEEVERREKAMSGWKDEYRKALLTFAVQHGEVMYVSEYMTSHNETRPAARAEQEDVRLHLLAEDLPTVHSMEESSWWYGSDTFNEGSEAHGLDLIVSCACGEVDHRRIRYEGTVGEILIGIFMEGEG